MSDEPLTAAGRRLLTEAPDWDYLGVKPWGSLADHIDAIETEARAASVMKGAETVVERMGWRLLELDDATGWRVIDDDTGVVADGPSPVSAVAAALRRTAEVACESHRLTPRCDFDCDACRAREDGDD